MAENNATQAQANSATGDADESGAGSKPATTAASKPRRKGNHKRRRPLILLALVVLIAIGGYAVYWFAYAQFHASTDDAYVHGNIVAISPQVSGTVVAIHADNTDWVQAGELLVQLDESNARIALAQAKANLAHTVREVSRMFANARQVQATIALRQTTLAQAQRDYQRARKLKAVNGISTENFQHAQTAVRSARASLHVSQQQLAVARATIANTTVADHPLVQQATARLRQAWLGLRRTRIVAPTTGYVAQRHVQVGEQVNPGSKLLAVIPLKRVWVEANFKETGLAHVRIGQPVTLVADLYDDFTYHGHVAGLAAGTGSAFSLLPAQNATGNWIKVVQRVPVRIAINPADLRDHPLRVGLSMTVDIDTHDRNGHVLAHEPASGNRWTTAVYEPDTAKLDALIQHIVDANRAAPPVAAADAAVS